MTAIFTNSDFYSLCSANELREYQIEVITYDGDSEIVYVEAYNENEALELASNLVENADYLMVQGYF